MNKKNIIKIRKIAFTKLRKLEVYTFYNEIVTIVKRFDAKAMHIGNTSDVLIGMQPKTELLELKEKDMGPHALTPRLNELHERRLKFAAIITSQMRIMEKAGFTDTLDLIALSKPTVYGLLNYLRKNDKNAVEQLILQFFYNLNKSPNIKDALYELGFKRYMDELSSANTAYMEAYSEKNADISRRPKGSTLPVQRELQNMLDILFNQVDSYQHVYEDVDYSGLITALNHVIATYTKLIKTRDTQRKNRKLKVKESEQADLEEKVDSTNVEKDAPDISSATSTTKEIKEKQKDKPPIAEKKKRGKNQPINGLMNILKKPDKGKESNEEEV